MPRFIVEHKLVFLLAFLVAVIYGGHHFLIWSHLKNQGLEYHPILVNGDEALLNAPKAQTAFLGKFVVGDFNVSEYKDQLIYVTPFLSPLIMGGLAKITGSIESAFIAGDFIFPPIIFLIFYLIIYELTNRKLLSLVSSAFFIFLPKLAAFSPPILKYLQAAIITMAFKEKGLYFSRIEDPQVTMPIYLLLLYFTIRSITKNDKFSLGAAAIFYGLTFYSYLYYWIYFSIGLVLLLCLFLLQKDFVSFKRMLIVFTDGILLSIPHWINSYNLSNLAHFQDIFERHGPEIGRVFNFEMLPSFAYGLHAFLIIATLFLRKLYPKVSMFIIAFLMPVFAVYNIQLLSGFNAQPDHWFKPTLPVLYIAFTAIGYWIFTNFPKLFSARYLLITASAIVAVLGAKAITTSDALVKFTSILTASFAALTAFMVFLNQKYRPSSLHLSWNALGVIIIAGVFVNGAYAQYKFAEEYKNVTMSSQEAASYEWLVRNTPKYSVIGSPSFSTLSRVQLYTHNKIFVPNGYSTIVANDEIWQRFFYINKLFGVTMETFTEYLNTEASWFNKLPANAKDPYPFFKPDLDQSAAYYLFHMRYHKTAPGSSFVSEIPLAFPKETIEEKLAEYNTFIKKEFSPPPYKLDYLYFGPREQKLGADPEDVLGGQLEKIYEQNGIVIYKIPQ